MLEIRAIRDSWRVRSDARAATPKRVSMTGSARDLFERRDDFENGGLGHDLAVRARTQHRLECRQVIGDLRAVFRRGSERIEPGGDSIEDDLDRCAQQHDCVEAVIDHALIRHAAGNEEPARVVAVDERGDLLEVPDRLQARWRMGSRRSNRGRRGLSMTRCPRCLSSASAVDFPVPDMPVTSTTDRLDTPSLWSAAGLPLMPLTA